jgi:CysZ protein
MVRPLPMRVRHGLHCALRAVPVLLGNRRLMLWSLLPFLLGVLLYAAGFWALFHWLSGLTDAVLEGGTWWRAVLRALLQIAFVGAAIVATVFTFTTACLTLAGPLYEWLSASTERIVTGRIVEYRFSLRRMLADIARLAVWMTGILAAEVCVLLLGLCLPVVGPVIVVPASAVLLSLQCMDYPMDRRRLGLRGKLAFARGHIWELVGMGLPILPVLAIPLIGVLALPFAVVAATILFAELHEERRDG